MRISRQQVTVAKLTVNIVLIVFPAALNKLSVNHVCVAGVGFMMTGTVVPRSYGG